MYSSTSFEYHQVRTRRTSLEVHGAVQDRMPHPKSLGSGRNSNILEGVWYINALEVSGVLVPPLEPHPAEKAPKPS